MILGIDVSTSKIGYCVIDPKQNLVEVQFKKLKEDYNSIETFEDLEGKTWVANLPEGRVLIRQF